MNANGRDPEHLWLERLSGQQPAPSWLQPSWARLLQAPEPTAACCRAAELLAALDEAELQARASAKPEDLADLLWAACVVAPFFLSHLRRRPRWLLSSLDEGLSAPRTQAELDAALDAQLDSADSPAAALRALKYYELLRITARDCSPRLVPLADSTITLSELSNLADSLLARALEQAAAEIAERFGPPRFAMTGGASVELSFCVLALGKHGAQELNYSSDVDLLYVFETPPGEVELEATGPELSQLAPTDYFTRLGQRFGKLVSETTADGFLYRVDLDLRPQGAQGTLVVSDEALAVYYESWADTWEKATFMKARPVAGDLDFGWRAIDAVAPMIYRSSMDYGGVDAIAELKAKIEAAHGGRREGFNVKIDAGGIRDIEFIAQAMQLLHGGRVDQVRSRSTLEALERLRDVHLLDEATTGLLLEGYLFLRRLENRLQMVAERQTHRLPSDAEARRPIAFAMEFRGDDAVAQLDELLEGHRQRIAGVFGSFFFDRGSDQIFDLFAEKVSWLLASDTTRRMLHELSDQLAAGIERSSQPARGLDNLGRFIDLVGQHRFYLELLFDRPEIVSRLAKLFGASNYLSNVLSTHPKLIEPVFADPDVLLLDRAELTRDLQAIATEQLELAGDGADPAEAELDALRLFFHRHLLNVGLLDLDGRVSRSEAERALTEIAETCLDGALDSARRWLAERKPELSNEGGDARFAVIGMGKLASQELSYGSDLDLIFLFDVEPGRDLLVAQEYCTRLAQRLISVLQAKTGQGSCYEIDSRLRPSGNQGTLVSSLASFRRYHERGAEVWERLVLLRARAIAGSATLAEDFEALRREILTRPLPEGARDEVLHVRQRMEDELARETAVRRDFKRGRGGLLDIENLVQWLQIREGENHSELLEVIPLAAQLERLARLGVVKASDAEQLVAGWNFLQRLGNRVRVVENRSISDLDTERGDLEGLARAMGYGGGDGSDGARRALLSDYRRHTEAIRSCYERGFA
ncbi:MAG: hypothetical protein OEZ06_28200 [Myxococcales bacterium]|nr:hypothetical protein [Myxococcales bacterium]